MYHRDIGSVMVTSQLSCHRHSLCNDEPKYGAAKLVVVHYKVYDVHHLLWHVVNSIIRDRI